MFEDQALHRRQGALLLLDTISQLDIDFRGTFMYRFRGLGE